MAALASAPGEEIPHRALMETMFGEDFGEVQAHLGEGSSLAAMDADGAAMGEHAAFAETSPSVELVAHELTHVVQARNHGGNGARMSGGMTTPDDAAEKEADRVAAGVAGGMTAPEIGAAPAELNRSKVKAAKTVAKRLRRWVGRPNVQKQVSKHVAKHGRNIAGKAVHSVFKNPNKIKSLVTKAADDALALAKANSGKAADEVIEGGGVRMARQTTGTPGKFRWVIEKEFKNAIGTKGEKILKIIVDESGRIVTAYPVERLGALGLSAAAMATFDAKAAEAGELLQDDVEATVMAEENKPFDWAEFIIDLAMPLGFGVSTANEGEDEILRAREITWTLFNEMLVEVEAEEQRTLDQDERNQLYELLETSVGAAMMAQDPDQETEDVE